MKKAKSIIKSLPSQLSSKSLIGDRVTQEENDQQADCSAEESSPTFSSSITSTATSVLNKINPFDSGSNGDGQDQKQGFFLAGLEKTSASITSAFGLSSSESPQESNSEYLVAKYETDEDDMLDEHTSTPNGEKKLSMSGSGKTFELNLSYFACIRAYYSINYNN